MRSSRWYIAILLLFSGPLASGQVRQEIHFPDLPGQRTLKCDFHMHSVFSDGEVWPTVRVNEAWRQGLDAISITDHIEYRPHKNDVKTNPNRPFEIAADKARECGLLLIRGAEITHDTPPGHFNAIFLADAAPLDTKDIYEAYGHVGRQKAFAFWNHPGWQGPERGQWGEVQTRLFENKQLHGIEICNGEVYYADAHRWAVEKGLTLVGNSDEHTPFSDLPWTATSHRTLTLVFARQKSEGALREALFAGRTAVWCQNRLIGPERYLAPLIAASLEVRPPRQGRKGAVWLEIANRCELELQLQPTGNARTQMTVPARATGLFKLDARAVAKGELICKVLNCLTDPNQPLEIKLTVPTPTAGTQPAGRQE
jgi:hypothetical protein